MEEAPQPAFVIERTVSDSEFVEARDKLRAGNIERDIISYAVNKIKEAEANAQLSQEAKNSLTLRYEDELKRVDSETDSHKHTVDLYELESARGELLNRFHQQISEIDTRINQLKPPSKGMMRWRK